MGIKNGVTFFYLSSENYWLYFLIKVISKMLRMNNEKQTKSGTCSARFWLNRAKSRVTKKKGVSVIFKL